MHRHCRYETLAPAVDSKTERVRWKHSCLSARPEVIGTDGQVLKANGAFRFVLGQLGREHPCACELGARLLSGWFAKSATVVVCGEGRGDGARHEIGGGRTVGVLASKVESGWVAKTLATLPEASMADGSWWCAVVPKEVSLAAWGSRIVSGEGDDAEADPRTAAPTTTGVGWWRPSGAGGFHECTPRPRARRCLLCLAAYRGSWLTLRCSKRSSSTTPTKPWTHIPRERKRPSHQHRVGSKAVAIYRGRSRTVIETQMGHSSA